MIIENSIIENSIIENSSIGNSIIGNSSIASTGHFEFVKLADISGFERGQRT